MPDKNWNNPENLQQQTKNKYHPGKPKPRRDTRSQRPGKTGKRVTQPGDQGGSGNLL